jgi:hypothetical protein
MMGHSNIQTTAGDIANHAPAISKRRTMETSPRPAEASYPCGDT